MTPRVRILDIDVDGVDIPAAVRWILERSYQESAKVAVGVNAHVCVQAAKDPPMREAIQMADLAYPDGQAILWAARALGHRLPERVATTDLVFPLVESAADSGRRIFFYGAAPGVAKRAADRLVERHPPLQISTSDGYVDDMPALVEQINQFGTDILFIGLGDPLQQRWIEEHRAHLRVGVILTCGGLFDWTSGDNPRPPQWMVQAGLEWLWRVAIEPRRLAGRYLKSNPVFMFRVLKQVIAERRTRVARR